MSSEARPYLDMGPRVWSAPDLLGGEAGRPLRPGAHPGEGDAQAPARRALLQARAEAQQALEAARADAEVIRERALQEGLAEAARALAEERERLAAQLATSTQALAEERGRFLSEAEPEMLKLAVAVAEKVIGREITVQPDIVLDLIRKSMKRLKDKAALRIRVNPEDLQLVREARTELLASVDGVEKIEVADDRRVGRGGCVIESPNGTLDARIATQLREIERTIAKVASHERDGGD